MDTLDHLQDQAEIIEQQQIQAVRADVKPSNATGCCWYCGKPTDSKRRWCDADCRDDWETENE